MDHCINNLSLLQNLMSMQENLGILNAGLELQKSVRDSQKLLNWAPNWFEAQKSILDSYNGIGNAVKNANFIAELNSVGTPKEVIGLYSVGQSIVDANTPTNNIITLNNFIQSHLQMVNVLNQLGGIIPVFEQNKQFQKLLYHLSTKYLKKVKRRGKKKNKENPDSWNDLQTVNEVTETIGNLVQESMEASEERPELVLQLYYKIITYYCFVIDRIKSIAVKNHLKNIFLILLNSIGLLSDIHSLIDVSNKVVVKEIKQGREEEKNEHKIATEHLKQLEQKVDDLFDRERISILNTNLRNDSHSNSQVIGMVKKGQEVKVIENRGKYLWITYEDMDTGEVKAGFVFKKYFEKIK